MWMNGLARSPGNSPVPPPQQWDVQWAHDSIQSFLCGPWEFKPRSSGLENKHFAYFTIFPILQE